MASRIALTLFFSLLFCVHDIASADFDFYYLVLEWPGSYCKSKEVSSCCKPDTPYDIDVDFFVKGLYTYTSAGQPVTKCNTTKFFVNALASIIGDLYVHWPSIECPSNTGVDNWRQAWSTYGVCSGLNQRDYFNTTLQLRSKVNVLSTLKSKVVFPTDILPYLSLYVKTALGSNMGFTCNRNKFGASMIHRIYVCVDKSGTKTIKCPTLPKSNCGTFVFLPTFSTDMLIDTSSSPFQNSARPHVASE